MIPDIIHMIALTAGVKICKYFNQSIKFNHKLTTIIIVNLSQNLMQISRIISDVCVCVCVCKKYFFLELFINLIIIISFLLHLYFFLLHYLPIHSFKVHTRLFENF